jgi:peptidoglycan hydrolase CwlO-like protein
MTSVLSSFIPFLRHKSCKDKINKLIQTSLDEGKKIHSLNAQVISLINQNQELKTTFNYQCAKLEKTIEELREKLKTCKLRRRPMKMKLRSAIPTSNV